MPVLCFSAPDGTFCQLTLTDAKLPDSIAKQMDQCDDAWFDVSGLQFDPESSDLMELGHKPLFFEWQRIDWLFEPAESSSYAAPYSFYVNNVLEPGVKFRKIVGKGRLSGSTNLGNAVGKTRFVIKDANGKSVFELGAEVFPEKLDYKEDFTAMLAEITEIVYSLAFDVYKKTYASTKAHTTYHQTLSEWLNLYRVLAKGFEQSIDMILRAPKSEIKRHLQIKPVELVKKVSRKSVQTAIRKPDRYCRGAGVLLGNGLQVSHLQEQRGEISYDIYENRFVVWAIKDVIKTLGHLVAEVDKQKINSENGKPKRLAAEVELLKEHQRQLRHRLISPALSGVASFNNQQQFSTTLTMGPGYKEFYHRYLLLRKGLTLADNAIFNMDYKDVATLYEYWCFLKTVKLLRDNPKYDLTGTDIIKIEHHRFSVNLIKGEKSGVHFVQRSSGDSISLYFNRVFSSRHYTHTFDQRPDNFIEFSRAGYGSKKDNQTFKVVLDAKYRFERGVSNYPQSKIPYGPPLDTIAQLHRYRDAILWEEGVDQTVKVANKSIGGVILFPYPNDESEFIDHPFYKSIDKVNIGAVPLQPGAHRNNNLYRQYLDSLFEQSGETINEQRIHFDSRQYDAKRQAQSDLVMVGMVPSKDRQARMEYHKNSKCFYTEWAREPKFSLEKVKFIALYDQGQKRIYALAEVLAVEFLLGDELIKTGTTWSPRAPQKKHCLYRLGELVDVFLPSGTQMSGHRLGRFFISKLGLDLAIEHNDANLLFINSWENYQEWKKLSTQNRKVNIKRISRSDADGNDISELIFTPELIME